MSFISDLSSFINPFGSPSAGKWNLSPGTWIDSKSGVKTVFFAEVRANDDAGVHTAIEQISDSGRRRLAKYEYPYVDGQKLKDLGRAGETYTFNIKFHGSNYQAKFKEFYNNVYRSNSVGILNHPVLTAIRGAVYTRLESFEPVHRADESNSVTIKATFVEDNSSVLDFAALAEPPSADTALQRSLKSLVATQANVATLIASATGVLKLPSAITATLNARNQSITSQVSTLLGQLGATFSSTSNIIPTLATASGAIGGVTDLSGGVVTERTASGINQTAKLPPVFQTGLDQNTQMLVDQQTAAFVSANQVTVQQAVFNANQARQNISNGITEAQGALGNSAYDVVVQYRTLAVSIQSTVEACIAASQSLVKLYTVPRAMSLRMIAFNNGLSADRQNDIESLNPYLPSVNFIPAGSVVTVPAA